MITQRVRLKKMNEGENEGESSWKKGIHKYFIQHFSRFSCVLFSFSQSQSLYCPFIPIPILCHIFIPLLPRTHFLLYSLCLYYLTSSLKHSFHIVCVAAINAWSIQHLLILCNSKGFDSLFVIQDVRGRGHCGYVDWWRSVACT